MSEFKRKEPYFNIKLEGDFTNWSIGGFPGTGAGHNNIKADCICENVGDVTVQRVRVKNISDENVVLTHVSSMLVNGIGKFNNNDYTVYLCKSGWQGEMQWHKYSCSQIGIYNASNHMNTSVARISFNGSQTTSEYYPMIMIQDNKNCLIYFFEVEPLSGWYFEIGILDDNIYVEANSAFIGNDGWHRILKPGEEYVTGNAYFGCVKGGFTEAIKAVNIYKRSGWVRKRPAPLVIFNDYMNCLWAKPDYSKLLPIIDAASETGCEVFCIDDGWYECGEGGEHLGDWMPCDKRFEPLQFSGLIEYIKSKNMIPGVWMEMEACSVTSEIYKKLNHCLLRRNGVIEGGIRAFLDFRTDEVRDYTMSAIDRLYNMGVRYIKNDYNHNLMIGCDGAESLSQGYAIHRRAFLRFIDEVREKYPDLILESCSSGAMRADYNFIKHMDLQSVSDQEFYYNNPSIVAGALSCIPAEHCGFWSYPCPLKYEDRDKINAAENLQFNCDSEETIFNMINSMLGVIYLSGHIEHCDKRNKSHIKEAIHVYKKYRNSLENSFPVYITEPLRIGESGVMAVGLKMESGMLMAVWKINDGEMLVSVNVDKNLGKRAKLIYPTSFETDYRFKDNTLDVVMKEYNCARLFWID